MAGQDRAIIPTVFPIKCLDRSARGFDSTMNGLNETFVAQAASAKGLLQWLLRHWGCCFWTLCCCLASVFCFARRLPCSCCLHGCYRDRAAVRIYVLAGSSCLRWFLTDHFIYLFILCVLSAHVIFNKKNIRLMLLVYDVLMPCD